MRRLIVLMVGVVVLGLASLALPSVRAQVRAVVRPDPPPPITPLAVVGALPAPTVWSSATPTPPATPSPTAPPGASALPRQVARSASRYTAQPSATSTPTSTPAPTPVIPNGRIYDAYIPAATKPSQFFQYSCEFDAAWVILTTYGFGVDADDLLGAIPHDRSIEPSIKETREGFLIYGGDITRAYSGDYTKNYLARTTGLAMRGVFEQYGLETTLVNDRAGVEQALRSGQLVWLKTTVDFNKWRPATWILPDGTTYRTVLGNDHAVVAIGFSERGVVIRDVLGPTSTNRQRPYEYEVDWATFMAAWGAQSFDGVAVAPPGRQPSAGNE